MDEAGAIELGRRYPITLVAYDLAWPARYQAEARSLRDALPAAHIGRIEHFGSTAVPGLMAKPILDILLEVDGFEQAAAHVAPRMEAMGYTVLWREGRGSSGHANYVKGYGPEGYLEGVQRVHVHAAPWGHSLWERLRFRDHLRAHPDHAARYQTLKQRLAREHRHHRERYTDGKSALIAELMLQA